MINNELNQNFLAVMQGMARYGSFEHRNQNFENFVALVFAKNEEHSSELEHDNSSPFKLLWNMAAQSNRVDFSTPRPVEKILYDFSTKEMAEANLLSLMNSFHLTELFVEESKKLGLQALQLVMADEEEMDINSRLYPQYVNGRIDITSSNYPSCSGYFYNLLRYQDVYYIVDTASVHSVPEKMDDFLATINPVTAKYMSSLLDKMVKKNGREFRILRMWKTPNQYVHCYNDWNGFTLKHRNAEYFPTV